MNTYVRDAARWSHWQTTATRQELCEEIKMKKHITCLVFRCLVSFLFFGKWWVSLQVLDGRLGKLNSADELPFGCLSAMLWGGLTRVTNGIVNSLTASFGVI